MWMATKNVRTPAGWVPRGRTVEDGDPALVGAADGDWVRVSGDDVDVVETTPFEIVEEATAEPGKTRRTSRSRVKPPAADG